jgi:branched-subunit amino acid transport protein
MASMTEVWATVVVLAAATAAIRAAGPVALGGRALPPAVQDVVALLAPALLSALVVTETFGESGELVVDESAAGVAAAGVVLARRGSLLVAIAVAAALTAALRALG